MRCPNPKFVWPNGKVVAVPCGKCLPCLSNKRLDWSARLMQEYRVSSSAYFVTLTYSDRFLPSMGVVKRHLQLYFKRLRKLNENRLRYYAVGEYGSKTGRPHYHVILFNCDEKSISKAWCFLIHGKVVPIGLVHIGKVTEASVSYVLKYVVQKEEPIPDGLNRGFALMSRGYGLGLNYLSDEVLAWHREGERVYMMRYNEKHRLPRFYKDKIWPNTEWSNWAYRRECISRKSQLEAEQVQKKDAKKLASLGYSPELADKMRNAAYARIKSKVAYSQKF